MFEKICKHCGCPLSYYKNRESVYGCQVNVIKDYGYHVGRHEYQYSIIIKINELFCKKIDS